MKRLKHCRYCGKEMPKNGNKMYYCSDWCRQHWHYEEQDDLFYVPGMKQEKCIVCGKKLLGRQLKYCSKACYFAGRHSRKRGITGEDIKLIKKTSDRK